MEVIIYWGSDDAFNSVVEKVGNAHTLTEILSYTNKTEIEIAGAAQNDKKPLNVDNLIINTDDYGSIKEWALMSFSASILQNPKLDIKKIWLNNPPSKFYNDIVRCYGKCITEMPIDQFSITIDDLKKMVDGYEDNVIGQSDVMKKVVSALYLSTNENRRKPVSILFLGDSGVGKTETAKYISDSLDQDMVRIQFSMQQTAEAYKFIFGSEHGEDSLARELIRRKSNIVLLDEFDKVHASLYNAFYQMFDEGVFVDSNYSVDVERCIIICTSNYKDEKEAEKRLGSPIYSRFSKIVKFKNMDTEDRIKISEVIYNDLFSDRTKKEQELLNTKCILPTFKNAIKKGAYKNIRMLKNDIEDAMNFEILKELNVFD